MIVWFPGKGVSVRLLVYRHHQRKRKRHFGTEKLVEGERQGDEELNLLLRKEQRKGRNWDWFWLAKLASEAAEAAEAAPSAYSKFPISV